MKNIFIIFLISCSALYGAEFDVKINQERADGTNALRIVSPTANSVMLFGSGRLPEASPVLTLNGGTVVASSPVLNLSQTWNNGAVQFVGATIDITDTASLSSSLGFRIRVGGVTVFSVNKSGIVTTPEINIGNGSFAIYNNGNVITLYNSGNIAGASTTGLKVKSDKGIEFSDGDMSGTVDGVIRRASANVIGIDTDYVGTPIILLNGNTGVITLSTGSTTSPILNFGTSDTGLSGGHGGTRIGFVKSGIYMAEITDDRLTVKQGTQIGWPSGALGSTAQDTFFTRFAAGVIEANGFIRTATPVGGTSANWKLGSPASVTPTAPNRTIEVDIGGTIYYIHAKTTND